MCLDSFFFSTWYKLESFGKRRLSPRKPFHQVNPKAILWCLLFIDDGCVRTLLAVSGSKPMLVVLSATRIRLSELWWANQWTVLLHGLCICSWVQVLALCTSYPDLPQELSVKRELYPETNSCHHKLVMVFGHSNAHLKLRHHVNHGGTWDYVIGRK